MNGTENVSDAPSLRLLTVWMGPLPSFLPLFTGTCGANPTVDFRIYSDQSAPAGLPQNVEWMQLTLDGFNTRASERLGYRVDIERGGKLADYKPTFGAVFEDAVAGYDFWGSCDLDLLWGRIRHFAPADLLASADVLSFRGPWWLSGALTIFRTATATHLFAEAPGYQETLRQGHNTWFDESCYRFDGVERTVAELVAAGEPVSLTDVARAAHAEGRLQLVTPDVISEPRWGWAPYAFQWQDGVLTDTKTGEERMLLHFVHLKHEPLCDLKGWTPLPTTFYVGRSGATTLAPEDRVGRWVEGIGRVAVDLPRAVRWYGGRLLHKLA